MFENEFFEKTKSTLIERGSYENCRFSEIDFSSCNFSGFKFLDCEFIECNLSLCNPNNVFFQNVKFDSCKMLGIHFEYANPFGLAFFFESCVLNHSSFYQMKLKGIKFSNCQLHEVDFSETDLAQASFQASDLTNALFDRSNLENADFRSASNYIIDPDKNKIKKAKFSISGIPGLLFKYGIQISD